MTQIQRLAVLVVGLWLGAGILADIAVTRNFNTVERFLANPGSASTASEIDAIGRDREREILRRNAAEENNGIFHDWERAELGIGAALIALLVLDRAAGVDLTIAGAMIAIVAVQALALSPRIAATWTSDPVDAARRSGGCALLDNARNLFRLGNLEAASRFCSLFAAVRFSAGARSGPCKPGPRFCRWKWISVGCARIAGHSSRPRTAYVPIAGNG